MVEFVERSKSLSVPESSVVRAAGSLGHLCLCLCHSAVAAACAVSPETSVLRSVSGSAVRTVAVCVRSRREWYIYIYSTHLQPFGPSTLPIKTFRV